LVRQQAVTQLIECTHDRLCDYPARAPPCLAARYLGTAAAVTPRERTAVLRG
jgi:hypothetical protein